MRVEQIGDATLYLGDCRDLLPQIRCDHVITDPPYEAEAHTKGRRLLGKQEGGERTVEMGALDFAAMTPQLRADMAKLARQACSGWLLTFCQAEAVLLWREAHEAAGAKYKRAMVWVKPDGAPQFTGDRPGMGYESIVASWCGAGRSRWNGGGRHGVFTHAHRDNNAPKDHMTQKPLALMKELVALFSDPEQAVADPFMGSGTTGVAALLLGRAFIGVEQDERHFSTACRRIEEAWRHRPLFVPEPLKAEQLGLEGA
jgi:site-specific DNA-methyltransferase (adenine-specific)